VVDGPLGQRTLETPTLRLACRYAFAGLDVQRMELHIAVDNVASRGVARRAGFTEAGFDSVEEQMVRYIRLARRL
jgi:RimJ/RimL family protein N-acetyltransferase